MSLELRDPRYVALQMELKQLNFQMGKLVSALEPVAFILDIGTISKAAAFADSEVMCQGSNLIQISTDGNLRDISYKVLQLDGRTTVEMEAAESPHILGPVTSVLVTNDTAEAGKTVRIARYRGSPGALAAIQHGTASSVSIGSVEASEKAFTAEKADYDGVLNYFETDQALGTTPTLYMTGTPAATTSAQIYTVKYQFTPTAAVTYQLYLLEDSQADDQRSESNIIFDSGAAQASGTIYIETGGASAKMPINVKLATAGRIWYLIDWSGAPGNTTGYIKVLGEVLS